MPIVILFVAVPLVVYLSLAALPRGKPAVVGIIAAIIAAGFAWVTGEAQGDASLLRALTLLAVSAIALAAIIQGFRSVLGEGRPRWVYPALVLAGVLALAVPLLNLLGM